ncbi:hypothetical protein OSB04_027230 [Centaurea solstitialis]|uniref:Cyclic nucleotide-binding domain-containing protein n=1 Tax=Centaurea solstitialis TaxID=347529 RepID=A0AA38W822_9ASTR|nr:hypothetical protein OSB04_027230 [Centaurea solstitialis]
MVASRHRQGCQHRQGPLAREEIGKAMPTLCPYMSRWINAGFRREKSKNSENNEAQQCYACSQFGVPHFHSTSCDPTHERHVTNQNRRSWPSSSSWGGVLDPRSESVLQWSRVVLLARYAALAVDPFFFFALAMDDPDGRGPCLYVDGKVARWVSFVRTLVDAMLLCHILLQFRLAYVSKESLVVGCGRLVWDARDIASRYLRSLKGFWLDAFVILPIPQVVYLWLAPRLVKEEKISMVMVVVQLVFMVQFIPKVYHCYRLMQRSRQVTGYVFGSIWWRFGLGFTAYFLASHASGGYWYALAIQRVVSCLVKQCDASMKCSRLILSCQNNFNSKPNSMCLDEDGSFPYGIYQFAIPIISIDSVVTKILYSNLWGLMAFRQLNFIEFFTMGNILEPTSEVLEVILACYMVLVGLLLFTTLIGNIQVFLYALAGRATKMQVKLRDIECWMKRRQLPSGLRKRVRHFENQRWSVMQGEDDMDMVKDLPEGLRRDIKRYLCLDMIKKAPLFESMDDVVLDNICDRVTFLVYSKGEKIIREGDPVQRMVFVVHGRVKRTQWLSRGMVATSTLESGSFFGDELLSWCLRIPFIDRYPAATATFTCVKATEAFALDADHLRYITSHFRYTFVNERTKRTARYYSSNWRTWAAINIQLAWRRYVSRMRRDAAIYRVGNGNRLRHYAAMFMSFRPHDHLE